MATLLEQGIIAAKNGQKMQAKTLFQQVLLADDRNERAWLWMSEAADSPIEQIACIERALAINPDNKTAELALQTLKSQLTPQIEPLTALASPPQTAVAISPPAMSQPVGQTASRKPFKLTPKPMKASNGQGLHRQNTVAMAATPDSLVKLRQSTGKHTLPAKKLSLVEELDALPIFPTVLFGTLSITAVTGAFLMLAALVFT